MSQAVAPVVEVGLVAAPGAPAELAGWLAGELGGELAAAHPQVRWEVRAVEDGLVQPPADDDEIVAATRRRLLTEDRDLAVALTDVPLEADRRPVVGSASPVHGVALLSLPALALVAEATRRAGGVQAPAVVPVAVLAVVVGELDRLRRTAA